jgi:MFS family permease
VSLVNKVQHVGVNTRPRSGDLGRLRVALYAVFAVHGFIFASWAVRVPAVKEQTGASAAALGLALLGLSAGAVITMLIAGALCRRFGSQRITVLSCALLSVTLVLPALAHSALVLGLTLFIFGAGYAAFALAEVTGRLSGIALLERFGRTRVLVLGGLTACAGMLLASLAPTVWLALIGFAATGLGLANLFPAAMARAGLLAGSGGVALTSMLGYGGFLLGPPAIGFLASEFGLRAGLTSLSFLALAAAVIAYVSADKDRGSALPPGG